MTVIPQNTEQLHILPSVLCDKNVDQRGEIFNEIVTILGTWEAPRLCGLNNTLRGITDLSCCLVDILYGRFWDVY